MIARPLAALALLVSSLGCRGAARASAAEPAAAQAGARGTLVVAASVAGYLVPCGCSPDQLGGLQRAAAAIAKIRGESPGAAYLDAGDLLFEGAPSKVMQAQAELKAKTLGKGQAIAGACALVAGARDLVRGPAFLQQAAGQIPLLDAGGVGTAGARAGLLVKAGQVPVGLLAAGLSDQSLAAAPLKARVDKLRGEGARVVVLLYHPREAGVAAWSRLQSLAGPLRAAGVDLVVLGHRDDPASDLDQVDGGPPVLVAPQGHYQKLLRIDLTLPNSMTPGAPLYLSRGEAGKREALQRFDERIARLKEQAQTAASPERKQLYLGIAAEQEKLRAQAASAVENAPAGAIVATASFLPLDEKVGEDAAAKALIASYDDEVAAMNLAAAKLLPEACPAAEQGEASFTGIAPPQQGKKAGAEGCAGCHQTEAQFWTQTNHAHAYATLVKVKKENSLDCVRCHVTGWQQPGGVCRIDRTAAAGGGLALADQTKGGVGRQDVQCEACHGAGSEHAADPPGHIEAKVGKATCVRCHEAANSPHFDFAKYLPGVVGPGHGKPLAKGEKPGPRWDAKP